MTRNRQCSMKRCSNPVVGRKLCRKHYQAAWKRDEFVNEPLPPREVARTVCPPDHAHGATRVCYVHHQCRCDNCRDNNRDQEQRRSRLKAYGRYDTGLVPAAPVREHMMALTEFGIGYKRAAMLAGIGTTSARTLIWGRQEPGPRYGELQKRVKRETAEKLFAVLPVVENLADGALIPARSTVRRLHSLIAFGWSQSKIAPRLGMAVTNLSGLRTNYERAAARGKPATVQVVVRTARRMADLYDELSIIRPPREEWRDKIAYSRACRMGLEHSCPLPMDWEAYDNDFDRVQPARRSAA